MVDPVTIGMGLGAASSVIGGKGAKKGGRSKQRLMEKAQNKALAMQQPYADFGQKGMNPLLNELGMGTGEAYQNPLLAQVQQQTLRDVQARQAASGQRYSGDTSAIAANALIQPAIQMQQQRIGNLQNMIAGGQNAATNQAGIVQNFAGPIADAGSQAVAAPYVAAQQGLNQLSGFAGRGGFDGVGNLFKSTAAPGSQIPVTDNGVAQSFADYRVGGRDRQSLYGGPDYVGMVGSWFNQQQ